MRCRSVCSRFQLWSPFLLGMLQKKWVPLQTPLRESFPLHRKSFASEYCRSLIFPRWDVVVIILSVFLMTYTYIEAKSNYHRGSILILRYAFLTYSECYNGTHLLFSYLVLTSGFFFAPQRGEEQDMLHSLSRSVINMFSTTRT